MIRFLLAFACCAAAAAPPDQVTWTFDNLTRIGGHPVTVLGHSRVIDTPDGKAIEFNGVDDALLIDDHPLAGAATYTWEAVFRPDGGNAEQRWFHLEEGAGAGATTASRMLCEIRVIDGRWALDAYNKSSTGNRALFQPTHLHDVARWYRVAAVYDGREFRSYVDGVLDDAAEARLSPQSQGRTAIGMRLNRVNFFKGAVRLARFTRAALPPSQFLPAPHAP